MPVPTALTDLSTTPGDNFPGGGELPTTADDYLRAHAALIAELRDTLIPAGTVIHVAMSSAPSGYLKANGDTVSRTTYANLFAAIGTTFGAGDGATTFKLPDLRGEFMRGLDDGRGVDAARALGSSQQDAILDHAHGASTGSFLYTDGGNAVQSGSGKLNISGSTNLTSGALSTAGGATRTATETRPRNVALLAVIKT